MIKGKHRKLFAFDLDGTLLGDNFTLLKENRIAIETIKESGHSVVIVTGRPWRDAIRVYNSLKLDTILASYNGALITFPNNLHFKNMKSTMNKVIIEELIRDLDKIGGFKSAFIDCGSKTYTYKKFPLLDTKSFDSQFGTNSFDSPIEKIIRQTSSHFLHEDPYSILLEVDSDEQSNEIFDFIKQEYSASLMPRQWSLLKKEDRGLIIEVQGVNANKGNAIWQVASYMNVSIRNTISFGDGLNDVEMLSMSGLGVAMKNGDRAVRMIADDVTKHTNKDGGVARYINNYLKIEKL